MIRVYENGTYRDATSEEIAAWEEAAQSAPAPTPTPEEQGMIFLRSMAAKATTLTDEVALAIPDLLPTWEELLVAGQPIKPGVCLTHNGQVYRMVQPTEVTPQANQPPGGEGMLAVYRPIDREHAGTLADPIPWVYGMDCYSGKYYVHNGQTYLAKMDMLPCVWTPGSAGTSTVWEEVV